MGKEVEKPKSEMRKEAIIIVSSYRWWNARHTSIHFHLSNFHSFINRLSRTLCSSFSHHILTYTFILYILSPSLSKNSPCIRMLSYHVRSWKSSTLIWFAAAHRFKCPISLSFLLCTEQHVHLRILWRKCGIKIESELLWWLPLDRNLVFYHAVAEQTPNLKTNKKVDKGEGFHFIVIINT